ncbi:aggrecan core protein-like isoform X1 [Aphelenchoides avenae]|nr:aggrecan core protein-like isoform X1 [Aphelenchus avenae]
MLGAFLISAWIVPLYSQDFWTTTTPPPCLPAGESEPSICPRNWTYYENTGLCYRRFSGVDMATWKKANVRCNKEESRLISIHNHEENEWAAAFGADGTSAVWIGLYRDANCTFRWIDGSDYDYNNTHTVPRCFPGAYWLAAFLYTNKEIGGRFRQWKLVDPNHLRVRVEMVKFMEINHAPIEEVNANFVAFDYYVFEKGTVLKVMNEVISPKKLQFKRFRAPRRDPELFVRLPAV